MPFLEGIEGNRLHYRDQGEGKPLVFLHGMGASADVWNYQVMSLHSGCRCICLDLRGHGASDDRSSDADAEDRVTRLVLDAPRIGNSHPFLDQPFQVQLDGLLRHGHRLIDRRPGREAARQVGNGHAL